MVKPQREWVFDLCGGHLALDFANTVSSRHLAAPVERLTDYGALLRFARQSQVLDAGAERRQSEWARAHPRQAEQLLARVRTLREALFRIFTARVKEEAPRAEDLEQLNAWHRELALGPGLEWEWAAGAAAPGAFLAPVVRAAVELLTSTDRGQVRSCAADDCVWLFLDTSKNHSRRWCDMKQCGNRAKARRFSARARPGAPP